MATTLRATELPCPNAVTALREHRRRRLVTVISALFVMIAALSVLTLMLGAASLSLDRALLALVGVGEPADLFVIQRLRLPRLVTALLAGASFGLAGALFQSTLRNPLASPDILGIASGASLGAVTAMLTFGLTGLALAGGAAVGAATVACLIWFFAWRQGLHSLRFVLVGVGFAYLCASLLAWSLSRADERSAASALVWTVGSVADVRGTSLALFAAGSGLLAGGAVLVSRWQAPLALGDDHARGLGVRSDVARMTTLALAVGLVALATSFVGPLAFVALVAPAIARRLLDDGTPAFATAVPTGAALVLAADIVAQHGLLGVAAPTGIVTGLVGAPYLLWLLARGSRRSRA